MSHLTRILCWLCCAFLGAESTRILGVFPTPSISHQVVFRSLTHELAGRGHRVEVITTDPIEQVPETLKQIDVHDISYGIWGKYLEYIKVGSADDVFDSFEIINKVLLKMFEGQISVTQLKDIVMNKKDFDILLVEAWLRFALAFSHIIKRPVIAVSSLSSFFDHLDVMGAMSHPLLYPHVFVTRMYNLTLWETVTQYCYYVSNMNEYKNAVAYENDVVRELFGEDTPCLSELQNNVDMMFLNDHPVWEGNRPVPIAVVNIGGIHENPQKDLPQELKQFLDSSVYGVIYVSFGTNFDPSSMPPETVQAFVNVFSELPYDVLWKWNQDQLPGRTEKIKISKWFPQSDLLRHPKVTLFIMQGGLQSTQEAMTAGVPMIGIPMMGDQYNNVERYEIHNIGKKIYLKDVNEETLIRTIKTVIEDESYRENVARLRTLMNDQPMSGLERAVWWTEHVSRHGARHLRAPAANMRWTEYYELELVGVALVIVSTVVLLACIIFRKILKLLKLL